MNKSEIFDRHILKIRPLYRRRHDLDISAIMPLGVKTGHRCSRTIKLVAGRILQAKKRGSCVIMMMGGHIIRAGMQ